MSQPTPTVAAPHRAAMSQPTQRRLAAARRRAAALSLLLAPALTGCMAANPVRPVLSCTNCGSLTYYGPQAPDPRVEMARVLTGGLSSVAGIVVGGDVLKSLGRASGATSTIERTNNTTNNTTTDRSAVSDVSRTSVSDTSVSDTRTTSVSETSVSDTTSSSQ